MMDPFNELKKCFSFLLTKCQTYSGNNCVNRKNTLKQDQQKTLGDIINVSPA